MRKKKQKQVKQLTNYLKFVAAGIVLVIIATLVSGCGNQVQDDGSSSGQKKVLSKAEIQELTDLVVTDSEDSFCEVEYGEDIEGVITDEFDWNSHYTYVWGWKDRGEDGDEIGSDPQILAQVSEDQKVLQTFSEDELALYHGKWASTEFVGATDQELVFCAESGITINEKWIWYRIPLSYENGQEKVLYEKKEAIYEAEEEWGSVYCGAGKYLLCGYDGEIFVLDKESGETQRVVKDSKDKLYGYSGFDPWTSPEGDTYVVLDGYQDHLEDSLYAYRLGTKEVQEITTGISSESRVAYGDGKVFFTGMVDHQMQNDYNLYVYDMLTGQKKVLASEAEIREILPEKPADHADFIREMAYAQGTLYLEIRYAKQNCVVSCTVEQGSLTLLEGLPELVRHREYQISEPIKNGNSRYYNVNDHNIFENSEDGIVERTLDGKYVRTIHLSYPYSLIYANNEELIFEYEQDGGCKGSMIYSIPLISLDGNDYPDINHRKLLLKKIHPEYDGDGVQSGSFYADEKYLVYISRGHDFIAYDRQAQKFLDIAGIPQERQGLMADNILNNMSGEYIAFEAHSRNRKQKGFLLYHFGDNKVTPLDHYGYDVHWSEDRKTLIYEGWSGRDGDASKIYSYHVDTGKKEVLFTTKVLKEIFKQISENQKIEMYYDSFSASGKIYYVASASKGNKCWVVSYDLGGGGLQYEAQITDFVNVNQDLPLWDLDVAEGKLFIKKAQMDEEGDEDVSSTKYYYYDLETGEYAEIEETDGESLYLSLVNLD